MPSGRTHDRITLWSLPIIVGLSMLATRNAKITLLLASGYLFSGLMFGPDLDIHSVQFKRWGLLRGIWLPYQKKMRHRSRYSHGFLIGTAIRVVYLLVIVGAVVGVGGAIAHLLFDLPWDWGQAWQQSQAFAQTHALGGVALFIGLELGAMSHSLADWTGSAYKRWQRRQRPKSTPSPPRSRQSTYKRSSKSKP
jgi:uncharacterized metal-binding protein